MTTKVRDLPIESEVQSVPSKTGTRFEMGIRNSRSRPRILCLGLLCGFIALRSYRNWQKGLRELPNFAWFVALFWPSCWIAAIILIAISEPLGLNNDAGVPDSLNGVLLAVTLLLAFGGLYLMRRKARKRGSALEFFPTAAGLSPPAIPAITGTLVEAARQRLDHPRLRALIAREPHL